jgi:dTDP-4-amino-4,6-dideoxygalactose transaminase
VSNGIEAKVHYPIPIYKQKALKEFSGNLIFPIADKLAAKSISFPCDQHLTSAQLDEIVLTVSNFFEKRM